MKKDIRLLALDLDGTTFNSRKIITDHTRETLMAACRQGVIVMPATGRPRSVLPTSFTSIPGVRYALTSNGSVIVDLETNTPVYTDFIQTEIAVKVVDELLKVDCLTELFHNGGFLADRAGYERALNDYDNLAPWLKQYIRDNRVPIDDLSALVRSGILNIEKIMGIFNDPDLRLQMLEKFSAFEELNVSTSGSRNVEINARSTSKGQSLLKFGEKLGITPEQIMICGDNFNDRTMFEAAGFSVAMGNASDDIKAMADFVTLTNDEDGVAYAVEKFILGK